MKNQNNVLSGWQRIAGITQYTLSSIYDLLTYFLTRQEGHLDFILAKSASPSNSQKVTFQELSLTLQKRPLTQKSKVNSSDIKIRYLDFKISEQSEIQWSTWENKSRWGDGHHATMELHEARFKTEARLLRARSTAEANLTTPLCCVAHSTAFLWICLHCSRCIQNRFMNTIKHCVLWQRCFTIPILNNVLEQCTTHKSADVSNLNI